MIIAALLAESALDLTDEPLETVEMIGTSTDVHSFDEANDDGIVVSDELDGKGPLNED